MNEKNIRTIFKILKKQIADVIISSATDQVQHIKFTNNRISVLKSWELCALDIFAAQGKKVAVCSIQDTAFNPEVLAKRVVALVRAAGQNQDYHGIAQGPFTYRPVKDTYDKSVSQLGPKISDTVAAGINTALEHGASRVAGVLEITQTEHMLLSTGNVDRTNKATGLYFSIRAFTDKDASGHDIAVARSVGNFGVTRAARKAAEIASVARNPKNGSVGTFDVLFEPLPFANLLEMVGQSASIFNVEAGLSFLGNCVNKPVASKAVTIHDSGLLPGGLASSPFDAEGVPSKETLLIDKGIFKQYLHNTSTARKYKTKSTANAGLIAPHPRNLILAPGKESHEKLMDKIKKGIYVTNVWYTRSQNTMTGDFSTIPRDGIFYVEDGKIKYPIKNIRISENMLHILSNIYAVGNNAQHIKGWEVENPVVTPSVLVKGLNITRPLEL